MNRELGAIEELASPAVHNKVLEIVNKLQGDKIFDAPTGQGAITKKLLSLGKMVTAGDINTDQFGIIFCNSCYNNISSNSFYKFSSYTYAKYLIIKVISL